MLLLRDLLTAMMRGDAEESAFLSQDSECCC